MATRPAKRGGVTRYSDLSPSNVPILRTEMDADLDPLWAAERLWTVNLTSETASLVSPPSVPGPTNPALYGIEIGNPDAGYLGKTRLYNYDGGAELTYNMHWGAAATYVIYDDPSEPCLTLDLNTGNRRAASAKNPNRLWALNGSYAPPGASGLPDSWRSTFWLEMQASGGTHFGLGHSSMSIPMELIHFGEDAQLTMNNQYSTVYDSTRSTWSLDFNVAPAATSWSVSCKPLGWTGSNPAGFSPFVVFPHVSGVVQFSNWTGVIGTLDFSGNLTISGPTATKASGTAWVNPSDPRLKTDIAPYTAGLAEIARIEPKTYRLKSNPSLLCHGFDAEAVKSVLPECIGSTNIDGEDYLTFDMNPMSVAVINAIKELADRVKFLEVGLSGRE